MSVHARFKMRLREVPGVPLVYLDRTVLVLEKISDKSRAFAKKVRSFVPDVHFGLNINHPTLKLTVNLSVL